MDRRPDFKRLKDVSLQQAVEFLKELGKPKMERGEMRFACPACGEDDKHRALAVHPTDGFTCYKRGKKSGTDAVSLVAHVRGVSQTQAAIMLEDHFFPHARPAQRTPSPPAKAEPDGRADDVAQMLGIGPATLDELGTRDEDERLVIPLRRGDGVQIGTLGIATRADQKPLLLFTFEEKAEEQKPAPDELRKLFRVV